MIIFKRIFSTLSPIYRSPLTTAIRISFCDRTQIRKLIQMRTALLQNCQKLQADKIIRLLHIIHFKSIKESQKSLLTSENLQLALQNLSSHLHKLTHQDLTLLLQTMSEIKGYQVYNRDLDVMRLLAKRINSINILPLSQKFKFRFIHVLQKMEFPQNIILKYVNSLLKVQKKEDSQKIPVIDALRIFIALLQMNYVHPRLVSQFYQKQVKKTKISNPKQMVYLFYTYKTLQKCLQKKIAYILKKQKFTTLISNPYPLQPEQNSQSVSPEAPQTVEQQISKQTKILEQLSLALIEEVKKQVDIKKLTNNICKFYQFQKYPLDGSTAIFLLGLKEMHPTLALHFEKNYKSMGINQFCLLLPVCKEETRNQYYEEYKQLVWKHISLSQKLTLLKLKAQKLKEPPTKQNLLNLLHHTTTISLKQFELISILSSAYLPESQQLEVINIVEGIIGDAGEK